MIRYRLKTSAGDAELELDVDNLTTPGAVTFAGGDAAVAALRRALLERIRVAGPMWRNVSGGVLCEWMESPAVRDLAPELVAGHEIRHEGGTFSRHDPAYAAKNLGRSLARLASSPRSAEIFDNGYAWKHVQRQVRSDLRELAALDKYGGEAHLAALEDTIATALADRGGTATWSGRDVLAAFRDAAAASSDEAEVLRGLWRRLDATEGPGPRAR